MSMTDIAETPAELDPDLDRDGETYKVAAVLLAALQIGADIDLVVEFTGFDRDWVATVAERLTASDIWRDGVTHCHWFNSGDCTDFWCDVLVGQGLMERRSPVGR